MDGAVSKSVAVFETESVLQPLAAWWFPYCPLLLSFQVGIFLAKDEMNRLRQEKQLLKKELEEVRKRVLWEDPVMVTECVWALGSTGKGCEPRWRGCR